MKIIGSHEGESIRVMPGDTFSLIHGVKDELTGNLLSSKVVLEVCITEEQVIDYWAIIRMEEEDLSKIGLDYLNSAIVGVFGTKK